MKQLAPFVLGLLIAAIPACPGRAAAPALPPSATSDAILALRRDTQGELRFSYRKEAPGQPPETVSVGLAADYVAIRQNESLTLHDYRIRRVLGTLPDHRFVNNSLFAGAWFRGAELENRVRLLRGLQAAGIDPKVPTSTDPFWMETDLGVVHATLPRPDLVRQEEAGRTRWLLKGEEVAAARFQPAALPAPLAAGLRRMWPGLVKLHPQIADDLAAAGRLPAELWVRTVNRDQKFETWHWTLVSAQSVPAAPYPLPRGLAAAPNLERGAFPHIFATLADAVAARKLPPSEAVYVGRARAAIARGAGLEAFLWISEMQLAAGPVGPSECPPTDTGSRCRLLQEARPLLNADPRVSIAFGKPAIAAADRHRFDDLPNAYLLELLSATRPHGRDITYAIAENDLLAGLQASPIANFCKDAGDFYLQAWDPFTAWQVLDFGRLMANHRDGDLLGAVDSMEADLLRRLPQFF